MDRKKYIETMDCNESYLSLGLESDHAYSILDARQVNSQRLVRLRNPWGEKEWKGNASENWTKWPKSLKSKMSSSSANDGVFWMRKYHSIFNLIK